MWIRTLMAALLAASFVNSATIDELIRRANTPAVSNQGALRSPGVSPEEDNVRVDMDMLFTREQWNAILEERSKEASRRAKRKALKSSLLRWKNNEIPYEFLPGHFTPNDRAVIIGAMNDWQKYTCLTFRPATSRDVSRIFFTDGQGCSSNIGRIPYRRQAVTLGRGCRRRMLVTHEIGHAVGMMHEQTRPDRDGYVKIHSRNIDPSMMSNFNKFPAASVNTYGVSYDYLSAMHYGQNAFTINGQRTITTVDPSYQTKIGNAKYLSFKDIKLANLMYSCSSKCYRKACPNGGYVDKHCRCQCPGYPIRPCQGFTAPPFARTTAQKSLCVDNKPNCEQWANNGYCTRRYQNYMRRNCAKSCGVCSGYTKRLASTRSSTTDSGIWFPTLFKRDKTKIPAPVKRTTSGLASTRSSTTDSGIWFPTLFKRDKTKIPAPVKRTTPGLASTRSPTTDSGIWFPTLFKRDKTKIPAPVKRTTPGLASTRSPTTDSGIWFPTLFKRDKTKIPAPVKRTTSGIPHPTTSPTPPPTTSPPTPAPCVDKRAACTSWKQKGFCVGTYRQYMLRNCPKSCNNCPTLAPPRRTTTTTASLTTTEPCVDKIALCASWTEKGYCIHSFRPYMLANCPRSCGTCPTTTGSPRKRSKTSTTTPASTRKTSPAMILTKSRTSTRTVTVPPVVTSERCEDKNVKCAAWQRLGFCTGYGQYQTYMIKNCRLSCGLCKTTSKGITVSHSKTTSTTEFTSSSSTTSPSTATSPPLETTTRYICVDLKVKCPAWANLGFCSGKYEDYMTKKCRRSCGLCKPIRRKSTPGLAFTLPIYGKRYTETPTSTTKTTPTLTTKTMPASTSKATLLSTRVSSSSTTRSRAVTETGGDIVDKNKNCLAWATKGYCKSGIYVAYMAINCKQSCQKVTGGLGTCVDLKEHCPAWARIGYCSHISYRTYMQLNCRKSCYICI